MQVNQTALYLSVADGHVQSARLLLRHGALVNAVDRVIFFFYDYVMDSPDRAALLVPQNGDTHLIRATRAGRLDMMHVLLEFGASVSHRNLVT